jgi:hypothetical protein
MIDRYTKMVLTVIAIALTVIAAKSVLHQSLAQPGLPTMVQICDAYFRCAEIANESSPRRVGEYGLRVVDGH